MNSLGLALAWSSVQVTFVAMAALVLERLASRRGPRAGSWVASTSLLLIVVLTPLAFCALPKEWTRRFSIAAVRSAPLAPGKSSPARGASASMTESNARTSVAPLDSGHGGFSWSSLKQRVGGGLGWGADSNRQGYSRWTRAWGFLLLSGTALCLVRLLAGLWGVRECRRRSVSVDDPDVLTLVESLRAEVGFSRGIEVRELPEMVIATAAAVGWRRPLVLLPGDWRNWNDSERRAVLAHEVAHIARADYAAGVVARVSLALHFYHPLVHWMVGRLQLQQELAADAQGARLAGGNRPYLLALSRLALRMERSPMAWPARAFLPAKGHLIRRIHVLKERIPATDGSLPATVRAITIALLVVVGLGAAALRGPAPSLAGETPPGAGKVASKPAAEASATSNAKAFDLSYIPTRASGFAAIRPAAIFQRPRMKPHLAGLDALIAKALPIGIPKLESIEQATFGVKVQRKHPQTGEPVMWFTFGFMVRSVDDFDWKSLINAYLKTARKADRELVEVRFEGRTYYKAKIPEFGGPEFVCFHFPDARTLVLDSEDKLRDLIRQGKRARPDYVKGNDWQEVEDGLIAVAIDNRDQSWNIETDEPEVLPMAPLLQNATRWVFGVDGADSLLLHAIATCGTDERGETIARTAQSLLSQARVALGQATINPPKGEEEVTRVAVRLASDLLQVCQVRRDGKMVDLSAKSHLPLEDLVKVLLEVGQHGL